MIEIFERILERAREDIVANMEAKDINATGRTAASFRVERYDGGVRLVMGGDNTAPLQTLEVGVAPEEAPKNMQTLIAVLYEWSKAKGIQFEKDGQRRSFAYLLGRRIQREGTLRHMSPEDVYTSIVLQVADDVRIQATAEITQFIHKEILKA